MIFSETILKGCFSIELEPRSDERGWFARTYCRDEFQRAGIDVNWMQINHSHTYKKGTIRGMHYQLPPHAEGKLIRCIQGAVHDVAVDIRKGSATFLQWVALELSAENGRMVYIPPGMAHGFQALTDDAVLIYHHSAMFEPGYEGGLHSADPALGITWPLPVTVMSDRDKSHPFINQNFKGI